MTDSAATSYGVHSEVGRLRKVLVCSPGPGPPRLTPTNADDLLFDDVMWVENAQRDHADFVNKLRNRGVEVVELHDLLAETVAIPEARDWLLRPQDRRPTRSGWAGRRHARLPGVAAPRGAGRVPDRRAGRRTTCPTTSARAYSRSRSESTGVAGVPAAAAAQHALHPRHHLLALRRRHPQPALLAGPPRRDPADEGDLQVPPRLRRLDGLVGRPRAGLGPGHLRGRRRHARRQRRRC